jgi:hypothetical protein
MRPGITTPPRDILAPLPVEASAGMCLATDPRGTSRWIYAFFPAAAIDDCQFWRYDREANTWQQLDWDTAVAALTGGGCAAVPGIGCAMITDPSSPDPGAGVHSDVWLTMPDTNAPFMELLYYEAATDTWVLAGQGGGAFNAGGLAPANLGGIWTGDCRMVHRDTLLSLAGDDDVLIIAGNGATYTYTYTISTATVGAYGAITRPAAAVTGDGLTLDWDPANPGYLLSFRGGGSQLADVLTIATPAWAAATTIIPGTEDFDAGTESVFDIHSRRSLVHRSATGSIRNMEWVDADNVTVANAAQMYDTDGTAHVGNGMVWGIEGNRKYIYIRRHSDTQFQRITLVE